MSLWMRAARAGLSGLRLAWERLESGVAFNPLSPALIADPYPIYARLREKDPVHRLRVIDGWLLTRYQDVDLVLRDYRRFSNNMEDSTSHRTGLITLLDYDPPDHTRLRSLVSQAFTPRAIRRLGPRISALADDLVRGAARRGSEFGLMAAVAYPLPVRVIAQMLGVPVSDLPLFERWSNQIALNVEPIVSDAGVERIRQAGRELEDYFEAILRDRRRNPREDMITALLAAEDAGERLSHRELIMTLILLLVAGNETTRNLIGNGMLALLKQPEQLEKLRRRPELMESGIDELLRFDPPVQLDSRTALTDCHIRGRTIRKGQILITSIGAANRDPGAFERPDVLDIARTGKSYLSFGRGIHFCLGASLAVREAKAAFTAILRRFPNLRLAAAPTRRRQAVLRGLAELRVRVDASPN